MPRFGVQSVLQLEHSVALEKPGNSENGICAASHAT